MRNSLYAIGKAIFLLIFFSAAFPPSAFPISHHSHKFHVTVTQIEFNKAGQTAEIVIRVFADDFENALSSYAKRQFKIEQTSAGNNKELADLTIAYLRDRFELKTGAGKPVRLNWSGIEGQVDVFWLYLEAKIPGGLDGARLRNRLFCELFDDQVNIVNTKHQGKQVGVMFEMKDQFKPITENRSRER